MKRAFKFVAVLLLGLALLTWGGSVAVVHTTRNWFERDLFLRAKLAVSGAQRALVGAWDQPRREPLEELLSDLSRNERVMAVAACSADGKMLAQTERYPVELDCQRFGARPGEPWAAQRSLPSGLVHVSAIPVGAGSPALGTVVLVHDLNFMETRSTKTKLFLFLIFGIFALAASLITAVAARLAWQDFSDALRRLLRGGGKEPESDEHPVFRDMRDLVQQISQEAAIDAGGLWTPQRLRQALRRYLLGEKVVLLANREPYIHDRQPDGTIRVLHPASGLVTALEPVMRACSGVWVAHGSGSADRDTVDSQDRVRVPPGEESYAIRRVWLTPEEEQGYYYGFANEGLWPLCHIAHARPTFRSEDFAHYRLVNQKFADAVCAEVDSEEPIILIQDYHFALAPRMIREKLPRAIILTFWHIPWPNSERFGICPFHRELLEGLLGSSILGFHTPLHCNNFVDAVDRFLEARVDREDHSITHRNRRSLVRPYPISVEWPVQWMSTVAPVLQCRSEVRSELGLPPDALLGLGVDRLDYTKGIEERLLAVERLIERFPALRGRFTFVQLAAPSRTIIERYRELNDGIERLVERINARFSDGSYRPIILLRAHHEPQSVYRFYRAVELCYVSSLHDGMNLVAKEFIAARDDERGALILSTFTGAARELTEALIVNPYDLEEASSALRIALDMPETEQRDRLRAMRNHIAEHNVYRWAGSMLIDAAQLRSRERLRGRLDSGRNEAPRR